MYIHAKRNCEVRTETTFTHREDAEIYLELCHRIYMHVTLKLQKKIKILYENQNLMSNKIDVTQQSETTIPF